MDAEEDARNKHAKYESDARLVSAAVLPLDADALPREGCFPRLNEHGSTEGREREEGKRGKSISLRSVCCGPDFTLLGPVEDISCLDELIYGSPPSTNLSSGTTASGLASDFTDKKSSSNTNQVAQAVRQRPTALTHTRRYHSTPSPNRSKRQTNSMPGRPTFSLYMLRILKSCQITSTREFG